MVTTVLELDLTTPILEAPPSDPLGAALTRRRPLLRDLVEGLYLAAEDDEVAGLVAHIGSSAPALSQTQELRDAVRHFAASGKRTVAWAESFGELGPGTVPYYLATAFDEIWIQPSGDVGLTGVMAQAVFVKDALAKLGVEPQLSRRREYKNAADMFLSSSMTDAHREAAGRLAASAMEQVVAGVASRRSLTEERVRELVDLAPLSAALALEHGLVDRLGYRDEVYSSLRSSLGESRLRFVHRYRRARLMEPRTAFNRFSRRPAVAVVHGAGDIHLGRGGRRGFGGGTSIGSESLSAAIRSAAQAPDVHAIVLRVDSPGGSYVASDAIRREVIRARGTGKPVIVSMGSAAASGGYFISMASDTIVAQPGTLTGSIGVFGGKAVVRGLLDRVGVAFDSVSEGAQAEMFSSYEKFTPAEWERLEEWLDRVYEDFTAKVADDRGLSRERVEEIARGRVWTGADAHSRGLVDELGGLERALDIACARSGLDRDEVEVRTVPRLGFLERFRTPESSEDLPAAAALSFGPGGGLAGPAAALAAAFGVPPAGVLTAPVLFTLR
ncbi:signal peptide peptidase SppA [Tenggerimyces flavus]|uniref:Signal peptide peptidase SppA n=1 Tax=Tenggerimyces flavus TaxID=1708749 RepID=A0ABV7YLJ1_9ACTN|nr:signal peptide peptidase SppA [Tenggerimyces flavus]MBM7787609.1 protease-4 [Tenggerimyces flavus]